MAELKEIKDVKDIKGDKEEYDPRRKREVIKTILIIFLAALLVLLFCSNTIMNKSLPQITTERTTSGKLTERLRGSGMVLSNQTYGVTVDGNKVIDTINVKVGKEVEEGDVLMVVGTGESEALTAAIENLEALELEYSKALLTPDADYTSENQAIKHAREDLAEAITARDNFNANQGNVEAAKNAYKENKAQLSSYTKLQEKLTAMIAALDMDDYTTAPVEYTGEILKLSEEYKNAEKLYQEKLTVYTAMISTSEEEDVETTAPTMVSQEEIAAAKTAMETAETEVRNLLLQIPNVPNDSVPEGRVAEDNVVERMGGENPVFEGFEPLPHWELAKKYDLIDFEMGVKITGAGFPIYKGKGARLQRALINFFLDEAREAGYLEVEPPYVVNEASGYGTGQLPDKEGQMYHATADNLYLIPTAEVPVTNIFRDVILSEKELPQKMCAYSACFRREAGSYGKDVRGLNRLHQFNKVEIVRIDKPEHSYESLDEMIAHVENLVKKLELPYRILRLCGGDMSFTSAITFDFEVYSAAQQRWLEVSSVSNFESYQANRLKCRYKTAEGKTELCHTLNGSALALPRIVAALLENHQTADGIRIPKALVPYCGFEKID